MPKFIIETTAESPIREFWQVEAESAEQARENFEAGEVGTFLWDEVQGDETDREVSEVHPFADLAGTVALNNAQQEAPAMLAALRAMVLQYEQVWGADLDSDENREGGAFGEYWKARAILARIDGGAK